MASNGGPLMVQGNQLWKLRTFNAGQPRLFKDPHDLLERCLAYFEWADKHPTEEKVIGWYKGKATIEITQHVRPYTIAGLTAFLGVDRNTWARWLHEREDLVPVIRWVEGIMHEQKFSHAAAGTMNAGLIARDLGLAEINDHRSSDGSMTPKPNVIEFVAPEIQADTGPVDDSEAG